MSPEQWLEVKELLAETLELPAESRSAWLDARCRGQPALRREIEVLLAAAEGEGFLDLEPPLPGPAIVPGAVLGPYKVERKLAEGGMGEVFQAFDTRLERHVAIKALPARSGRDRSALKRFERETKALAALSHPNILAIFDVGESGGAAFAVTELLSGTTLRERLRRGKLPVRAAVAFAEQAARGLAAAHAVGIVHRDLKPENLFVTADGQLKVLDFGIATFTAPQVGADAVTLTAEHAVIGTVGYMAPEQARGIGCDHRSDVFSLGAVLYEMLTGAPAFTRATLLAVVDQEPPPLETLCPEAGAALIKLVGRCLEKEPGRRFQSASDLAFYLAALAEAPAPGTAERSARGPWRRRWLAAALAVVVGVVAAGSLWLLEGRRPSAAPSAALANPESRSIAVLPFANLSGDPNNEYFSDGLSEELINALAKNPRLRVCSRTSAFALKGKDMDLADVAAKLHVEHVLEGSVRKADRRVRITAQLIEVASDSHLWSEVYDRELDDVFAIQDDIARSVASALAVRLVGQDAPVGKTRPVDVEVYNLYLQGRYFFFKFDPEGLTRAIDYYQKTLELDPGYALAWSGLAEAHFGQEAIGDVSWGVGVEKARYDVGRALELDPELARAQVMACRIGIFDWNWAAAETACRRAGALDPRDALVLQGMAFLASSQGRLEEAVALSRQAIELDPLNGFAYDLLAWCELYAGRLPEAEAAARKVQEINPDWSDGPGLLALVYLARAKPEAALEELQRQSDSPFRQTCLILVYDALGRRQEADAAFAGLLANHDKGHGYAAYLVAQACAMRGEKDCAFEWLERAYARRERDLYMLKWDPMLHNLEDDPRFVALLRKLRLPP